MLKDVDHVILWRAAQELRIAAEDWPDGDEEAQCRTLLAVQLLASDLREVLPALRELTDMMRAERRVSDRF